MTWVAPTCDLRSCLPRALVASCRLTLSHGELCAIARRSPLAKFRCEAPTDVGRIVCGVLSVCGPVNDDRAICLAESMGASGWTLEEADLGTALGCTVKLLNNFIAVGLAVGSCNWRCDAPEKLITIHKAHTPQPSGTIAVLGPGTGLGSCFGVWASSASSAAGPPELQIFPSEGGESDFVPRSDFEWRLRQHLAHTLSEHRLRWQSATR